jgi:hypothetical protein
MKSMLRGALIGSALLVSSAGAQSALALSLTFDQAAPSGLPSQFEAALTGKGVPPRWEVIEDKSAAGGKVLAELSGDRSDYRFPLAILKEVSGASLEASIRFKAVSGKVDQAAGIAFRLQDENNYYVVRANALENNVRLYTVIKGDRKQMAGKDIKVPAGVWQTLTVRALGNRIEVEFNGQTIITKDDASFPIAGRVALWTKADSLTHFESLAIKTLQ